MTDIIKTLIELSESDCVFTQSRTHDLFICRGKLIKGVHDHRVISEDGSHKTFLSHLIVNKLELK